MDYVTRQFINLTKKLRKDIRKYASDLNGVLHKQIEAIREAYKAAETKRSSTPEVTVLNHFPESIEVHQNAKDTGDERNYRRASFFVTSLTLGAIVVYAALVRWQYREMVNTRLQMQGAIDAANRSATAAETANTNAVASERPWVGMTFAIQDFEKSKHPRYVIQFTNTGRRPAKVRLARGYSKTYKVFPQHPAYLQEPGNISSTAVIVPNATLTHADTIDFPSETELAELRKFPRQETLYIYASIDYEDVFTHASHWTHGCWQYYPEYGGPFGSWVNCPTYNEVDEDKR
jgi:hypothetical protein